MEKAEEIGDDLAARIGMGAPDAPTPRRPGTHGVSRDHAYNYRVRAVRSVRLNYS
jgi:hypothetical protein